MQIRDIIILDDEDERESLENPISKFYLTAAEGNLYFYSDNEWKLLNEKENLGELSGTLSSQIDNMMDLLSGELISGALQCDFSGFAVTSGSNTFIADQSISGDLNIQYNDNLESVSSLISNINSNIEILSSNQISQTEIDSISMEIDDLFDLLSSEITSGSLQIDFSGFAVVTGSNNFIDDQTISGNLKIQYNDNLESVSSLISRVNFLENNVDSLKSNQVNFIDDYYIIISGSVNPSAINGTYEMDINTLSGTSRIWSDINGNKILHTEENGWEIQNSVSNTILSCNGGVKPTISEDFPYNESWFDLNENEISVTYSNEIIIGGIDTSYQNTVILENIISKFNSIENNISILSSNQILYIKDYYITISGASNPSEINEIYELNDISMSGFNRIWESVSGNKIIFSQENGWEIQDDELNTLISCNGGIKPDNSDEDPYNEVWHDLNENSISLIYSNKLIFNEDGIINKNDLNSISKGSKIINQVITSIKPENNKIYKHVLNEGDIISINTTNLSFNYCINFEVWLKMPSTLVTFTFGNNIYWNSDDIFSLSNNTPDFSDTNMLYVLCFRYDGRRLLANLAYKINLNEN